jgi:hypothetical protein
MNKEDLFILLLALLLLAAMIYTLLFGGQGSKHGVSFLRRTVHPAVTHIYESSPLDLCQGSIS